MISKNKLQSIISKYYLGGKVESVKWKVKNGKLDIDFMAPTKDMIGRLSLKNYFKTILAEIIACAFEWLLVKN